MLRADLEITIYKSECSFNSCLCQVCLVRTNYEDNFLVSPVQRPKKAIFYLVSIRVNARADGALSQMQTKIE